MGLLREWPVHRGTWERWGIDGWEKAGDIRHLRVVLCPVFRETQRTSVCALCSRPSETQRSSRLPRFGLRKPRERRVALCPVFGKPREVASVPPFSSASRLACRSRLRVCDGSSSGGRYRSRRCSGLAAARKSLSRGLGSCWFTERFHRNALVTHFQHSQVFCTAR